MQRSRSMNRLLFLTFRSCSSELLVRSRCCSAFSDSRNFAFSLSTVSWISNTSSTSLQCTQNSVRHKTGRVDCCSLLYRNLPSKHTYKYTDNIKQYGWTTRQCTYGCPYQKLIKNTLSLLKELTLIKHIKRHLTHAEYY